MENYKFINWDESLSVGYIEIDGHHKKLISIMQELHSILSLPANEYRLKVGKILKKLSDYTVYHFEQEEKIMRQHKYPSLEEHAKIHASFIKKLNESLPLMAGGDKKTAIEMYNFLGAWLVRHIAVDDHKWSNFIHEKYPNETF
ncbi:MAG: bacteriohemerythrin [Treponema sp.]